MLSKKEKLLEALKSHIGSTVQYKVLPDSKPIKATLTNVDDKFAYLKFTGRGSRRFGSIATLPHKIELIG